MACAGSTVGDFLTLNFIFSYCSSSILCCGKLKTHHTNIIYSLYRHVVLKIYMHSCVASEISEAEMEMYKRMNRDTKHPGSRVVRSLLDSFRVKGPDGEHQCLVHQPLWEDLYTFLKRDSTKLLPKELAASTLYHLFLALDFIHRECGLIHTGKANGVKSSPH